jgi:hypothetical protein
MATKRPLETDLYPPVKALLEGQGYEVKGEVGAADVVAIRGEEAPVIVELKTGFSLSLFHQGVERQAITDYVYLAVPRGKGAAAWKAIKNNAALCRRLGLGLMTVRLKDGLVEIHTDPAPYRPRKSKPKTARLLREFAKRVGDPTKGGSTRAGLVTAYRQDALRCVSVLTAKGPTKASEVAKAAEVSTARQIMYDDHYGWFERAEKGIYALSPKGVEAASEFADTLNALTQHGSTA